jgi:hypothetical protein
MLMRLAGASQAGEDGREFPVLTEPVDILDFSLSPKRLSLPIIDIREKPTVESAGLGRLPTLLAPGKPLKIHNPTDD